jgi:hypothetical protein
MADVQVTCIEKPHPNSPHEHITHVGNPAANWKWDYGRMPTVTGTIICCRSISVRST